MNKFEKIFLLTAVDFIIIFNMGLAFDPFKNHFLFKVFHYYFAISIVLLFFYYTISKLFPRIDNYYCVFIIIFITIKEYFAILLYGASVL